MRTRAFFSIIAIRYHSLSLLVLSILLSIAPLESALAESGPNCRGLDPTQQTPLNVDVLHPQMNCPDGQALVFHAFLVRQRKRPELQEIHGNCCPLPAESLLDDHIFSNHRCDEDRVVTGGRMINASSTPGPEKEIRFELRCTKINLSKWKLRELAETVQLESYFQDSVVSKMANGISLRTIGRRQIPSRYRLAFGRLSPTAWSRSGCLAVPWGAPLTAIGTHACEGFEFRILEEITTETIPPRH